MKAEEPIRPEFDIVLSELQDQRKLLGEYIYVIGSCIDRLEKVNANPMHTIRSGNQIEPSTVIEKLRYEITYMCDYNDTLKVLSEHMVKLTGQF